MEGRSTHDVKGTLLCIRIQIRIYDAVIMSCLLFGRHCSLLTERGCHVACALIGTNCNTLRRVETGVATRLPGVWLPLDVKGT